MKMTLIEKMGNVENMVTKECVEWVEKFNTIISNDSLNTQVIKFSIKDDEVVVSPEVIWINYKNVFDTPMFTLVLQREYYSQVMNKFQNAINQLYDNEEYIEHDNYIEFLYGEIICECKTIIAYLEEQIPEVELRRATQPMMKYLANEVSSFGYTLSTNVVDKAKAYYEIKRAQSSIDDQKNAYKEVKTVFERAMNEISTGETLYCKAHKGHCNANLISEVFDACTRYYKGYKKVAKTGKYQKTYDKDGKTIKAELVKTMFKSLQCELSHEDKMKAFAEADEKKAEAEAKKKATDKVA